MISTLVASAHEPKPAWPPNFTAPHPLMGAPGSPGGWWYWQSRYEQDGTPARDSRGGLHPEAPLGHCVDRGEWLPVDCLQPFWSMRLLKELLEMGCNLDLELARLYFPRDGKTELRRWVNLTVKAKDQLEDTIVRAWLKAKGIDPETTRED